MTERTEDRGVGRGYPPGETRAAIIRFLMAYPEGIEEPKIRDWLREKYGLKEKKSISNHLAELGAGRYIGKAKTWKEGKHYLIKKEQSGKDNIWKLNLAQKMQRYICVAMLKGDITALVHEHFFSEQENEDTISLFNSGYVQRAIDTTFLPLFKKRYGIDTSIEETLPKDLMTFIESGFKMSPTAVLATLAQLHLVDVAVGMFMAALYKDTTRKLDKVALAVITLYACLLTDLTKYCLCPGVEDKIRAFLSEPRIISTISTRVGWDFTGFDSAPLEPTFLRISRQIPPIKGEG